MEQGVEKSVLAEIEQRAKEEMDVAALQAKGDPVPSKDSLLADVVVQMSTETNL